MVLKSDTRDSGNSRWSCFASSQICFSASLILVLHVGDKKDTGYTWLYYIPLCLSLKCTCLRISGLTSSCR